MLVEWQIAQQRFGHGRTFIQRCVQERIRILGSRVEAAASQVAASDERIEFCDAELGVVNPNESRFGGNPE